MFYILENQLLDFLQKLWEEDIEFKVEPGKSRIMILDGNLYGEAVSIVGTAPQGYNEILKQL